jgi:predicted dehydrogenase
MNNVMKNPLGALPAVSTANRRQFLRQTTLGSLGVLTLSRLHAVPAAEGANSKIVAAVMGLGRGMDHVAALLKLPNVELAYLCDVDKRRLESGMKVVAPKMTKSPQAVQDFRRILEDKSVDALFIATGNYWHAPATILGCAAGKHVYVEKPGSHDPYESELMVAAARKHQRIVQLGTQRRSYPGIREGIQKLHEGIIGRVLSARSWYNSSRASIGRGKVVPVPEALDYSLWQGPAPERPYLDNLVHYNWHWRWHWGNGELGNNGPHYLDLARWGLNVDTPRTVTYTGGRYFFEDDQETPDTGVVTFDFGACGISWDHSSCQPRKAEQFTLVNFYGDKGTMAFKDNGYIVYDLNGKQLAQGSGPTGDTLHIGNFLDCIRSGQKPNAEIEEGQRSTRLCHLGNIAYRTGHALHLDPQTRKIVNDSAATALWRREYRSGWEPKV